VTEFTKVKWGYTVLSLCCFVISSPSHGRGISRGCRSSEWRTGVVLSEWLCCCCFVLLSSMDYSKLFKFAEAKKTGGAKGKGQPKAVESTSGQGTSVQSARQRASSVGSLRSVADDDDDYEDVSGGSSMSIASIGSKRAHSPEEGSSAQFAKKPVPVKRGRGRPPTTGEFVGVGKARAEIQKARALERQKQEAELEAELEADEEEDAGSRRTRLALRTKIRAQIAEQRPRSATELLSWAYEEADSVLSIAKRSSNLKGTFVRSLKDSVGAIKEAVEDLAYRTTDSEIRLLMGENGRLKREAEGLRRELEEVRTELRKKTLVASQATSAAVAPSVPLLDEVTNSVLASVATLIDAKFEGLRDRLLPEPSYRPPLAASSYAAAARASKPGQGPPAGPKKTPAVAKAPAAQKTQAAKPPAKTPPAPQSVAPQPSTSVGAQEEGETWTEVGRKKRVRRRQKKAQAPNAAAPAAQTPKPTQAKPKGGPVRAKTAASRIRPPRAAAVVFTLQPGAEESGLDYRTVARTMVQRIPAADFGSPQIGFKVAATGARILEITGSSSMDANTSADILADRLRQLYPPEVLKVARPIKRLDLRVVGLDDAASPPDVVDAVAKACGVPAGHIDCGVISRDAAGAACARVSVPVAAAKALLAKGRVEVGWVSARVKFIEPGQIRCYRCLMPGHMAVRCKSEVDRSVECFRCGQTGHIAVECSAAEPRCSTCSAAGRPAAHRAGGKGCSSAVPPKRKGRQVAPSEAP
jgi:hypothetical protein